MRQMIDAWESYHVAMWLTVYLERRLGGLLTEDEISRLKTLRGSAALVETRLAPNDSAGYKPSNWLNGLWSNCSRHGPDDTIPGARAASLNLDVPRIDAIKPRRWDET